VIWLITYMAVGAAMAGLGVCVARENDVKPTFLGVWIAFWFWPWVVYLMFRTGVR